MKFLMVSPRIAIQKGDFLGSGIPYWPVELATLASFLRDRGKEVSVADLFGANPKNLEERGDYYLQGEIHEIALAEPVLAGVEVVVIYAMSYMSHGEVLDIVAFLHKVKPELKILVLENSQAVTAYALPHVAAQFFEAGATGLICGEAYWNWDEIESWISSGESAPSNVVTPQSLAASQYVDRRVNKAPSYPVPAWDLFHVKNYWALPYAHGPKTKTFFPMLTSRGCPYPCDFCVVPETNHRLWRARTASEVVHEMLTLKERFGVSDFQLEDLNPTVKGSRIDEMAKLLIDKQANLRFYIVSGTKAETVKLDKVPLYAQAGCRYISISPESGSPSVMKSIGKPFDYAHGKALVAACHKHGIATQACFIIGHPAEEDADFEMSLSYLKELVRAGLTEVAVFVVAPFAGSKLFQQNKIEMGSSEAFVSFSPKGRANYSVLESRRQRLIRAFFVEKLKRGTDLWIQGLRALFGVPATKMENLPKRVLYVYYLVLRFRVQSWWNAKNRGVN